MLNKEFKFYVDNQNKLVEKYNNRFIVIKNCEVIGDYADAGTALRETSKKHEVGTFLIQECKAGEDSYTHTFHSRVIFN